MPPSIAEYKARLAEKHKETVHQSQMSGETMMGVLRTAAVSFDKLTSSDEWNRFLSKVQGELETAQGERQRSLLACGGAVGDALHAAQLQYQHYNGYVMALEKMTTFPHQVMSVYQDVKKENVSIQSDE